MSISEFPHTEDAGIRLQQALVELRSILGPKILVPETIFSPESLEIAERIDGFLFYVPEEFSTPGSLAVFSNIQREIRNEYLLDGTVPTLNKYDHFGLRYLDLSGSNPEGEGLTFNEFFFATMVSKKQTGKFLGEGLDGIRLSGSQLPDGRSIIINIDLTGMLARFPDGGRRYANPLSLSLKP